MSEHIRTKLVQVGTLAMSALLAFTLLGAQSAHAADITINPSKAATGKVAVIKGKKYKLGVKATTGAKVTYKSSNNKVASVTKKGTIKAKKAGKATVTITGKKGKSKVVKKVRVTVVAKSKFKKVKGIKVYSKSRSIKVGGTTKITPVFKPDRPSNKNLVFKSSNPSVAKVSPKGTVKGLSAGKATITVKSADNPRSIAKVKVTVKPKRWVVDEKAYNEKIPLWEAHCITTYLGGHEVFIFEDEPNVLYTELKKITTDSYAEIAPKKYLNVFYSLDGVEALQKPDAMVGYEDDSLTGWLGIIMFAYEMDFDVDQFIFHYGTLDEHRQYGDLNDKEKALYKEQLKYLFPKLKAITDDAYAKHMPGTHWINTYTNSLGQPKYFLTGYKTVHHKEAGHWE